MEIYNKYKIEHTDGTPLKGKKYFVLRLDSDNPMEAARVARAMRAYEEKPRNCDVGYVQDQILRYSEFYRNHKKLKAPPIHSLEWAQRPYEGGAR